MSSQLKPLLESKASSSSSSSLSSEFISSKASIWSSGFYKRSIEQRLDQLKSFFPRIFQRQPFNGLSIHTADEMIENCIGIFGLPLGIALNFKIDGILYPAIPMSTEEASIVAACSNAAKTILENSVNGFITSHLSDRNVVIGQILLKNCNSKDPIAVVNENRCKWIKKGNKDFCKGMVKRGGGIVDITLHSLDSLKNKLIIHLHVDVVESMGGKL
jgi:hydroxymethylglutaryl-CoA reductase